MESLLLIVTVIALALGAVMSLVAWRLLRDRARDPPPASKPSRRSRTARRHTPVRRRSGDIGETDEELADERHWDLALRRDDDDRPAVSCDRRAGDPRRRAGARAAGLDSPAGASRPASAAGRSRHASSRRAGTRSRSPARRCSALRRPPRRRAVAGSRWRRWRASWCSGRARRTHFARGMSSAPSRTPPRRRATRSHSSCSRSVTPLTTRVTSP